jgi:predicted amidophosphoribosyltransferase
MDWFAALFNAGCALCGRGLGDCHLACETCAHEAQNLELSRPVALEVDGLPVIALGEYEGWLRDVILHQKASRPTRPTVRHFARLLHARTPETWHTTPLAWVPGPALADAHLVERIALELGRLGQRLSGRALLSRRLLPRLPQKGLSEGERRSRDLEAVFRARRHGPASVVLLDDVVTTGATLAGCRKLLEEQAGARVVGALALARTPRYCRVKASKVSRTSGSEKRPRLNSSRSTSRILGAGTP